MQAFSDTPPTSLYSRMPHEQLVALLETRDEQIKVLEQANETAWNEVKRLQKIQREHTWNEQIKSIPNKQTSAADKVVGMELRRIVEERKPDDNGMFPIHMPTIGEHTGLSDDTASKSIAKYHKAGKIVYKVSPDESGNLHSFFSPTPEFLTKPAEIVLKEEGSNHGGKRIRCQSCGSDELVDITTRVCKDCGAIHSRVEKPVNRPEEEEEELEEEIGTPLRNLPTPPQRCTSVSHAIPAFDAPDRDCIRCDARCWVWDELDDRWKSGCEEKR